MACLAFGLLAGPAVAQEANSNSPAGSAPIEAAREQVVSTQTVEQGASAVRDAAVAANATTNPGGGDGQTNIPVETAPLKPEAYVAASYSLDEPAFTAEESRSRHAARVNRDLWVTCLSILSFFILCRLLLLWQIAWNRKNLPREEKAFEN